MRKKISEFMQKNMFLCTSLICTKSIEPSRHCTKLICTKSMLCLRLMQTKHQDDPLALHSQFWRGIWLYIRQLFSFSTLKILQLVGRLEFFKIILYNSPICNKFLTQNRIYELIWNTLILPLKETWRKRQNDVPKLRNKWKKCE